ncbi:hypothetical protein J4212_00980 [Candidatus Woesearchaeota archaeon]|nr:hypothetical protein [Candidatus Woesearchaeota archaeon]
MKKAQLISQVFIYIVAVLVTAFILGFGYKAIASFKEKAGQASELKLRNDMTNAVKTISSDYGSVRVMDIRVPGGYNEVCFVKTYNGFPSDQSAATIADYPIIKNSIDSNSEDNVFLVDNIERSSFAIGKIDPDPDFLCAKIPSGILRLKLEGMGDHTRISALPLG